MKSIEAIDIKTKDEKKELYNPYNDLSLWLQLAFMDFTFNLITPITEAEEQV